MLHTNGTLHERRDLVVQVHPQSTMSWNIDFLDVRREEIHKKGLHLWCHSQVIQCYEESQLRHKKHHPIACLGDHC